MIILFTILYGAIAGAVGWLCYTYVGSEIYAHPSTRGREYQWVGIAAGVILGFMWPITIPFALITALILK